ncbi:MAG: hypothetical protein WHZ52_09085 [Armatimonadota bacterium]
MSGEASRGLRRLAAALAALVLLACAAHPLPASVTISSDTYVGPADTTYDGQSVTVSDCTLTIDGAHSLADLAVVSNGRVTHTSYSGDPDQRLDLSVAGDLTIESGSSVDASYRGYPRNEGPGAGGAGGYIGTDAGSGGFGGNGGSSTGPGGVAYGSITEPADWGSGGHDLFFPGGAGGGRIRLNVGGRLVVNGAISSNGDSPSLHPWGQAGCGSGGSIWITAAVIEGSGSITARGGGAAYLATGGGGGRIAIHCGTNSFTGTLSASGGPGAYPGGAGSIYTRAGSSAAGVVLIDNEGPAGAPTPLTFAAPVELTVRRGARAVLAAGTTLRSLACDAGVLTAHNGASSLIASVNGNAALSNASTVLGNVTLEVGGDLFVSQDSRFDAYQAGFPPGEGPGAGQTGGYIGTDASAGGHGGNGADGLNPGGAAYGSLTQPTEWGSGGRNHFTPGGYGGGAVRLAAGGTLTLNGVIDCNGGPSIIDGWGSSGAGAGGSVYLSCGTLAGTGSISANGGGGGVGGGGGRVALHYGASTFTGTVTAFGGDASKPGGAGTIFIRAGSDPGGVVLIDNGGRHGAWTPLEMPQRLDVTLARGAVGYSAGEISVRSLVMNGAELRKTGSRISDRLRLSASGNLIVSGSSRILGNCTLSAAGNALIEAGSEISADADGYGPAQGPGAGGTGAVLGGGAGHGAAGSPNGDGFPGLPYGSPTNPVEPGSGGGGVSSYPGTGPGGTGGGVIRLDVGGTLTLDGEMRANATNGIYADWGGLSGGGSGGSILISCGALAGDGKASVNGGWPRGAGGRIAVYAGANSFSGRLESLGGWEERDCDGTVFLGTGNLPSISEYAQKYYLAGRPTSVRGPDVVLGSPRPVFSLVNAPSGMSIDAYTGAIDWSSPVLPGAGWSGDVTVVASNAFGQAETPLNLLPFPKEMPDGSPVRVGRVVVTARLADCIYLQPHGEIWGIRLHGTAGLPDWNEGDLVRASGTMGTLPTGERFVLSAPEPLPEGQVAGMQPVTIGVRWLGGGDQRDAFGFLMQRGPAGGTGVNTIGRLIRTWGRVSDSSGTSFTLEDGSGVRATVLIRQWMSPPAAGELVSVTGICSLDEQGGRVVLIRKDADVVKLD